MSPGVSAARNPSGASRGEGDLEETEEREVEDDRPEGHLQPLPEGAEFMYLRGREMHTEQGIVVPSSKR